VKHSTAGIICTVIGLANIPGVIDSKPLSVFALGWCLAIAMLMFYLAATAGKGPMVSDDK